MPRRSAAGGAMLLTTALDRVLDVDVGARTVTVQPGVPIGHLDAVLAAHGLGLETVAGHHGTTVGALSAVGGLSAASLHAGLFVDAVLAVEYVDVDGAVRTATARPELYRVLGELGSSVVPTELRLRVGPAAPGGSVLRNRRRRYTSHDAFVADAQAVFVDPGPTRFARGTWLDLSRGHGLAFGTLSAFEPVAAGGRVLRVSAGARATAVSGGLRTLGRVSLRLSGPLGAAARHVAAAGRLLEPRYARDRDVQSGADGVLGWQGAGRSRELTALTRVGPLPDVFAGMYAAARTARLRDGGVTSVGFHLTGVRSAYLSGGEPPEVHVAVRMAVGVDDAAIGSAALERLRDAVDDVCRRHGASRDVHTLAASASAAD